jgi:hypothetical protein
MILKGVVVVGATVALIVGTGMRAAPAQNTLRPGDPTQGRVWIENRGRGQAVPIVAEEPVPVVVQNVATSTPMPVRLVGTSPGAPAPPVLVRHSVQPWEYRTLSIPGDVTAQSLTSLLTAPGNEGWEAAGVQLPSGGGTLLVLKRPRP